MACLVDVSQLWSQHFLHPRLQHSTSSLSLHLTQKIGGCRAHHPHCRGSGAAPPSNASRPKSPYLRAAGVAWRSASGPLASESPRHSQSPQCSSRLHLLGLLQAAWLRKEGRDLRLELLPCRRPCPASSAASVASSVDSASSAA